MSDIFVSYKKDDRAIAERLVAALRAAGKEVWWDDALTPHEAWDAMIERQIAAARTVIVLWSPRSIQSDWVRSEAHYAQDHHKMVPVMVEHCTIPLAFLLRQAVDLTDGRFDASNPNWTKLLAWIDAVQTGDTDAIPDDHSVPPAVAAAAAVPAKAASGERWLGPSSKPKMLALFAGLAALAALAFFALRGMAFGHSATPDVYIDRVTVAAGPGVPADLAQAINDETTAQLNAASRVTPLDGDGKRHNDAYQLSGSVRMDNGKLAMFAKIYAPGITAPILSPRIEVPDGGQAVAAKYLGSDAASLLRCIATASDSSGSDIVVLPEAAMRPWAQYCQYWILGGGDGSTVGGQLELVVKAAPKFANGWATLAEYRSINMTSDATAGPFLEAVNKALAVEPDHPKATMLKAMYVVGIQSNVPLRNFAEFEALATKANKARPSDCGCEAKLYTQYLWATGRFSESMTYTNRIIANDPSATFWMRAKQYVLDALGRTSEAQSLVTDLDGDWPGDRQAIAATFDHAVNTKDWATAKALAPKLKVFPGQSQVPALIDAIQSNNLSDMDSNVAPLIAALSDPDSANSSMLPLIAATGHERELLGGLQTAANKYGAWAFTDSWTPAMKSVRAQPEFVALVKKYNLPAYWRLSDHRPDICKDGRDEPVCKLI